MKGKPGATLPKGRTSLKRQEYFQLGKAIENATTEVPGGVAYRDGLSDAVIAEQLASKIDGLTPAIVAKTRQAVVGNIAGEKGGLRGKLEAASKQITALQQSLAIVSKRVEQLELAATAPAPQPAPRREPVSQPPPHQYPPAKSNGIHR